MHTDGYFCANNSQETPLDLNLFVFFSEVVRLMCSQPLSHNIISSYVGLMHWILNWIWGFFVFLEKCFRHFSREKISNSPGGSKSSSFKVLKEMKFRNDWRKLGIEIDIDTNYVFSSISERNLKLLRLKSRVVTNSACKNLSQLLLTAIFSRCLVYLNSSLIKITNPAICLHNLIF